MFMAMEDNGGRKVIGIRQIVRLKELLQKWQSVTLGPKAKSNNSMRSTCTHGHGAISPATDRRLKGSSKYPDLDEDSSVQSLDPPVGVPKGYLAVYVGPELRRFIIPASYLSQPLFKILLEKVEEEFGFEHNGGLTIPCDTETFKYLLQHMEAHNKDQPGANDDHKKAPGLYPLI
ncbi:hypothetical protein NMG60_11013706 [Bertholletia excelsa]